MGSLCHLSAEQLHSTGMGPGVVFCMPSTAGLDT